MKEERAIDMKCLAVWLAVTSLSISVGSAAEQTEQPCAVRIHEIKIEKETALATVEFTWSKDASDFKKKDMTVVVLLQPAHVAPLTPEVLTLSRDCLIGFAKDDLIKITSAVLIKDDKGKSYSGALILFNPGADSKVDFRKSGKQTIPIRMQSENRWTGAPAIEGKGVLSIGLFLFKPDDPKLDQLKCTKYKQLSNVVTQEVELK